MKSAKSSKAVKGAAKPSSKPNGTARTSAPGGPRFKVKEESLFPSLLWHADFPGAAAYNKSLIAEIQKMRAKTPSIQRSNVKGWHSSTNLYKHPALRPLCVAIIRVAATIARSMKTDARARPVIDTLWINVNPKGAYNSLHNHPESVLSGVYYVQGGSASGRLRFRDPRSAKRMAPWPVDADKKTDKRHWDRVSLVPAPGRIVMFPSWFEHDVEVNESDQERISVSFNLVFRRVRLN